MTHTLLGTDSPISRIQLAFNGEWETSLHVTTNSPGIAKVAEWLLRGESDLAIEAFYPTTTGEAFVGVRLAGLQTTRQYNIALELVDELMRTERAPLGSFIRSAAALLPASLFGNRAAFAELGKVNAWRSFGPIKFWSDGNDGEPLGGFNAALAANPHYLEASKLPYAIELAFDGEFPHWLGLPISTRVGSKYVISRQLAARIFADL